MQCVCSAVQRPFRSARTRYTPHRFTLHATQFPVSLPVAHSRRACQPRATGDDGGLWSLWRIGLLNASFATTKSNVCDFSRPSFSSKGVELLVCDLLLTLRTSLWQRGGSSNGEPGPAPGSQLAGFQRDLSALRKLTQCYRQAQHKVRPRGESDTINGNPCLWGSGWEFCHFRDPAAWPAAGPCFGLAPLRSHDSRCRKRYKQGHLSLCGGPDQTT